MRNPNEDGPILGFENDLNLQCKVAMVTGHIYLGLRLESTINCSDEDELRRVQTCSARPHLNPQSLPKPIKILVWGNDALMNTNRSNPLRPSPPHPH